MITFALGIGISMQIKTMSDKTAFVNIEGVNEMETQILIEEAELNNLNDYLDRKKKELSEYKSNPNAADIINVMKSQLDKYLTISGSKNLIGEGIEVRISDSIMVIKPDQNPNDFVVHDQDILRIINDLKIAGAEAISINNQRYMGFSEIKCSGPTITINGKTFGQPFIIRAIGDIGNLESAIKSVDSYSYTLNSVYGIETQVRAMTKVEIPKYSKSVQYSYLTENKEEK